MTEEEEEERRKKEKVGVRICWINQQINNQKCVVSIQRLVISVKLN